jgi:hypothetical protein
MGFTPRVGSWGEELDRKRVFLLETNSKHPFQIVALERSVALERQLANGTSEQKKASQTEVTVASKVNKSAAQPAKKTPKEKAARSKSITPSKVSTKDFIATVKCK